MDSRQIRSVLVLCVCLLSKFKFVFGGEKVRLRDVQVLTLHQGKMTTGRRSSPVLQLKCAGGSAGCSTFVPEVVQCYNRGSDGLDAQWECKTDMENKYRFGKIDVNCEGYDYSDDPYILRGSCGLEYTIELTDEGRAKQGSSDYHGRNNYQYGSRNRYNNSSALGEVVMFVIVAVIFYMVFKTCTSNRHIDTDTEPPVYSQDPNTMGRPGPSAPPPPYSPEPPGFKREYTQGNTATPPFPEPEFRNEYTEGTGTAGSASTGSSSNSNSGFWTGNTATPPFPEPEFRNEYTEGTGTAGSASTGSSSNSNSGFWTGAAAGGLLGYLFGGRTRTNYHHNPYNRGWGGGGWGGGGWGSSYQHTPHYGNTGGWSFGNFFGGSRPYRPSSNSYGFSSFGGSSSSSSSSSPSSGSRTASGMGGTSRR